MESNSVRDERLFSKFLVDGYKVTTLNTVNHHFIDHIILAKLCLGMLITLLDDLADNPKHIDAKLLSYLYRLIITNKEDIGELSEEQQKTYKLARSLIISLYEHLEELPNYEYLKDYFYFDLEQVFSANKYSALITQKPEGASLYESSRYGHFNMGIVAAGMIDLMGISNLKVNELGEMRAIFHYGQRIGRISNIIYTYEREMKEGDFTNELLIEQNEKKTLENIVFKKKEEACCLLSLIFSCAPKVSSFSCTKYKEGLTKLDDLHLRLKAVI